MKPRKRSAPRAALQTVKADPAPTRQKQLMTAHAAASYDDPALADWMTSGGSADSDLLSERDTIVRRSRDLERNNGYVSGAVQAFKDNIVGHKIAINPAPIGQILGWTNQQVEDWARATRAQFDTWFNDPSEIDAGRMMSGRALTIQAIGSWFLNGDHFALPQWRVFPGCRWSTKIQAIESDRVDTPSFALTSKNIRQGIEYDTFGAMRAVWVRKTHPGDDLSIDISGREFVRIPAYTAWGRRRVIALLDRERTGQSRGRPLLAAIMREIRMAGHYTRTELQATIANSLVAGILESALDPETAASLFSSGTDREEYWKSSVAEYRPRLKGGAILQLPLGASFKSHVPNRPNNAFDDFMQSVLHHIAAGLGISYEVLSKDFSRTNYSSARASLLETWRYFMSRRTWLEENWLQPIYELWLEEAVNAGVVDAPGYYENRFAYARCAKWTMAGRGWVDPLKEAQGSMVRRRNRVSTLQAECAEQGLDWREVLDQIEVEERYMRDRGIDPILPEAQNVRTDNVDEPNEDGVTVNDAEQEPLEDDQEPEKDQ
jgi:lambda family phage portal protein